MENIQETFKKTEAILVKLFSKESLEDKQKILKENGLTVEDKYLNKLQETKERFKVLSEDELKNVTGGSPNFKDVLESIFSLIEVGLHGTASYLRTHNIPRAVLNAGAALVGNFAQDAIVQEIEEQLGSQAGIIARLFFVIHNGMENATSANQIIGYMNTNGTP